MDCVLYSMFAYPHLTHWSIPCSVCVRHSPLWIPLPGVPCPLASFWVWWKGDNNRVLGAERRSILGYSFPLHLYLCLARVGAVVVLYSYSFGPSVPLLWSQTFSRFWKHYSHSCPFGCEVAMIRHSCWRSVSVSLSLAILLSWNSFSYSLCVCHSFTASTTIYHGRKKKFERD